MTDWEKYYDNLSLTEKLNLLNIIRSIISESKICEIAQVGFEEAEETVIKLLKAGYLKLIYEEETNLIRLISTLKKE